MQDAETSGRESRPAVQHDSKSMKNQFAVSDYAAELQKRNIDVRSDTYNRTIYSTDASIYQVMPLAVVLPKNREELHASVELAFKYSLPVLPRGAGTSLAGQAVNEAVVIDTSKHLDKILSVDLEQRQAVVEPGVIMDSLNNILSKDNLQFMPDPATSGRACFGGIVGNNASGSHSIVYGMTADHVLGTEVILSDGSVANFNALNPDSLDFHCKKSGLEGQIYSAIRGLTEDPLKQNVIRTHTPKHWRRCGGYNLDRLISPEGLGFVFPQQESFNLSKLICGAEGGLGVMSTITLDLVSRPKHKALCLIQFSDTQQALKSVPYLLQTQTDAIEFLDNLCITLCRKVPQYAAMLNSVLPHSPECVLIAEVSGESKAEVRSKLDEFKLHCKKGALTELELIELVEPEAQARIWAVRKAGLGILMSIKGEYKPIAFIEDAAVPVEKLAPYIAGLEEFCEAEGTKIAYYAHASGGCLHVRPLIDAKLASEVEKIRKIAEHSLKLVSKSGGSLSSEHGDGRSRSKLNEILFGKELSQLHREVKEIFDPQKLMNPGIIVDSQELTENMRYGTGYPHPTKAEKNENYLNFDEEGSFEQAVEMCNGAGVCRKLESGAMCPSFMATREEEHSTRGRANLLRAALSGKIPRSELLSTRMYDALDLCVSCKACKAECPSQVDMAKFKTEFLARYQAKHGVSLRTRLFAAIPLISRLTSGPLAPFANAVLNSGLSRKLNEMLLGISAKRTLPEFARESFVSWFKARGGSPKSEKTLVLFVDTFTNYNYPSIGKAAIQVLESLGYEVELAQQSCCGRPAISKGLVAQAKRQAQQTVDALLPYAERGLPIVGLEPSCILTLKDEYFSLLGSTTELKQVAKSVMMIDEFLLRESEDWTSLEFQQKPLEILLHTHCHHKAVGGSKSLQNLLKQIPKATVTELDTSCCGMAGSFGYEKEHYDVSISMAERRLLPSVREATMETVVTVSGVSCRQQIKHGSDRQAKHFIEVIAEALQQ